MAKKAGLATRATKKDEPDTRVRLEKISGWFSIGREAIRVTGLVLIVYFLYRSIDALAGHITWTNIVADLFPSAKLGNVLCLLAAGGGVGYGWRQKRLRQTSVQHLHGQSRDAETQIDPGRTSSRLTERGETRPEDRV